MFRRAEPGESADQLMGRYMEHMYPELFKRASHPVIFGQAAYSALDMVGIENATEMQEWTDGAMYRYRSRRYLYGDCGQPQYQRPP